MFKRLDIDNIEEVKEEDRKHFYRLVKPFLIKQLEVYSFWGIPGKKCYFTNIYIGAELPYDRTQIITLGRYKIFDYNANGYGHMSFIIECYFGQSNVVDVNTRKRITTSLLLLPNIPFIRWNYNVNYTNET